jgi:hypothetical protein
MVLLLARVPEKTRERVFVGPGASFRATSFARLAPLASIFAISRIPPRTISGGPPLGSVDSSLKNELEVGLKPGCNLLTPLSPISAQFERKASKINEI